ncbi:MAG TPA: hypothetical protein VFO60_10415 [Candidatus Dormibacteraeota bacterium]|nr:hypothetical protein [Candidatus Dormibacteraeota bacterium]
MSGRKHADWFRARLAGHRIAEFGGPPRWGWRWMPRRLARRFRRLGVVAMGVAAVGATSAGVALALTAPATSVTADATQYRIGNSTLRAVGPGEYSGDGTLVITQARGLTRAASSDTLHGLHAVGICDMSGDGRSELCLFDIGGRSVTAADDFANGGWHRRYADGQTVDIAAAAGTPIPFAVGR